MKKYIYLLALLLLIACGDEYLQIKSDKSLVVPSKLEDLDNLLNYTYIMNTGQSVGVLAVDDFFLTDAGWTALSSATERAGYSWQSEIYNGATTYQEWRMPYQQLFYANTVLDILPSIAIAPGEETHRDNVRGRALFYRAMALYNVAQVFCPPYYAGGENNLGIPVRTAADLSVPVKRATVQQTYTQIITDLEQADDLLPLSATHVFTPTVAAAKAMLAKVYLAMENFEKAEAFASEALQLKATLMNYNTLSTTSTRPVPRYNAEVLFQSSSSLHEFTISTAAYIDTLLVASYSNDDLRKSIFFRNRATNRYTFKGNYTGTATLFTGLATDEVYLNRAEARARLGNSSGALQDINTLLITRFKTGKYLPVTETDPQLLLKRIILERQKELVFRPERWTDVRRLNRDPRFARTMARKLKGIVYTLPANDQRFVYPIPPDEINYSGIEQNPR